MERVLVLLMLATALCGGCGETADETEAACVAGARQRCACPDGSASETVCSTDGSPGQCACPAAESGDCDAPGSEVRCACEDGARGTAVCKRDRTLATCLCDDGVLAVDRPDSGFDAGPSTPPSMSLRSRCCHGLGLCLDAALVPEAEASMLAADTCGGDQLCVPEALADPTGFSLQPCRSTADVEGRCVPNCGGGDPSPDEFPRDLCDPHHRCVPCFDPFTGEPSGACSLSNDPGPREPPLVFPSCCDLGQGPEGHCLPERELPPQLADALPQETCEDARHRCVLATQIEGAITPKACTTRLRAEGRCIRSCQVDPGLQGLLAQQDCADDDLCVPCSILGTPTGVCELP